MHIEDNKKKGEKGASVNKEIAGALLPPPPETEVSLCMNVKHLSMACTHFWIIPNRIIYATTSKKV